jgi:hypothetical protein
MKCQVLSGDCDREAKWKVPLYGEANPHCLCDEHVDEWRANQPHNVKAIDDNSPWVNEATQYYRDSRVARG